MPSLKLTFLGSGTSMGVPTIGCECRVCQSANPRDRRTRPSVLLSYAGRKYGETNPVNVNVVVDTTPDFRYQALRAGIKTSAPRAA